MTLGHYILNDDGTVKTVELMEWAEWMEKNREKRMIARDEVGDYFVSTVFLGLDYNHSDSGDPVLFETMTFEKATTVRTFMGREQKFHKEAEEAGLKPRGEDSYFFGRWRSKSEALEEHARIVEAVREAQKPVEPLEFHEDLETENHE